MTSFKTSKANFLLVTRYHRIGSSVHPSIRFTGFGFYLPSILLLKVFLRELNIEMRRIAQREGCYVKRQHSPIHQIVPETMERGIEPGSVTEGRPDWWTGARTGELIVGLTVQRMDGPPKLTDTLAQASVQTLTLARGKALMIHFIQQIGQNNNNLEPIIL